MQRDEIHLRNILRLADEIESELDGISEDAFHDNDTIRSAILLKLIFIGEATRYISADLKDRYPDIRWSRIVGFRNVTVHQYWEVDWGIVWDTAIFDAAHYREQVRQILKTDFQ